MSETGANLGQDPPASSFLEFALLCRVGSSLEQAFGFIARLASIRERKANSVICGGLSVDASAIGNIGGRRDGAQRRIRTTDTRIFSPLLYQLSYLGLRRLAGTARRISEKRRAPLESAWVIARVSWLSRAIPGKVCSGFPPRNCVKNKRNSGKSARLFSPSELSENKYLADPLILSGKKIAENQWQLPLNPRPWARVPASGCRLRPPRRLGRE